MPAPFEVTVYSFVDETGEELEETTTCLPDAMRRAEQGGLRVVANRYEFVDSEVIHPEPDPLFTTLAKEEPARA
jgi:hypothetical protein